MSMTLRCVAAAALAAAAAPAFAAPPTEAECHHPTGRAMAEVCEARYRLCAKPPNEEWRGRWRVVCGANAQGGFKGGVAYEGGSGKRAIRAVADVTWQPKPGASGSFVPVGTLSVSGASAHCRISETVPISAEDGELEVQRGAGGQVARYRGFGSKTVLLNFDCKKAGAARPFPVAWFATGEAFITASAGLIEGRMDSPPDSPGKWTWRFAP